MIKVVCWNIGKSNKPLDQLAEMAENEEADVALLQEVGAGMAVNLPSRLETGSRRHWDSKTWHKKTMFDRWPMVVKLSDRVDVEWFDQVGQDVEPSADEIALSGVGLLAVARVIPKDPKDGEPFVVASMYARLFFGADGAGQIIANDLSAFIGRNVAGSDRTLAAGDINVNYTDFRGDAFKNSLPEKPVRKLNDEFGYVYQIYKDEERYTVVISRPDGEAFYIRRRQWKFLGWASKWCWSHMNRYAELRCKIASGDVKPSVSTWESMKAQGFELMGPQYPNGRQPADFPFFVPANSENVVTYYDVGGSPETGFRQLDYVFASRGFHERVKTRALNGVEEWGASDHCRIMIEVAPE